jgi:hypothetical protein
MNFNNIFEELNKLYEEDATEHKAEEPVKESVEDTDVAEIEAKQVVIECAKCGALVIKDEADLTVSEETDLVNVEESCAFCEEAEGYKIIGTVVPYEASTEVVEEGLGDVYRKVFDKPASTATQQAWEDELNGEMGEISDKRRQELEKKFLQQRDWEARHAADKAAE